ncbi:LacI family transcriptional regulator [Hephaestia caeni]|uniref:LacI family transcriptional regulator n=1 Tax=Hephaestia caeni TaxID=645617 RepID=A0A397PD13_9SPHN|nr:LacI family DNA-binding transcriptional regulator [Hephaestia caeni]RIA46932.1 LacI family transcriptional regulator [Hephaestia caeni]
MGYLPRDRAGAGVTIHDVANEAGVSIRTVSRVLNKSPKVNRETRARIEAAIAHLEFKPSPRARGLATGRSYLIGVVHNDRNALVLDAVQRGVVAEASGRGYELVVHPAPAGADGSVEDVLDFVRRSRVDGVVVLSPVSGVVGMGAALHKEGVPAVAISSVPIEGFSAILVSDERRIAAEVAHYLVDLGHRHIATINGPTVFFSASERRAGFIAALAERGLSLSGEDEGNYDFESGYAAAERLLAVEPRPTAIFAANDIMAAAVLKAAVARGISVPDMLSVVGFDGSMIAEMLTPALTTVNRPLGEMAQKTTRCLLDLIEGVTEPADLGAVLTIVEGGSTAPPPQG